MVRRRWISQVDTEELISWFKTGDENKALSPNQNMPEKLKDIVILKKCISINADFIMQQILRNKLDRTCQYTNMIALIYLSSDNFYCKKIFKQNFDKIIRNLEDLVLFVSLVKEIRGFGKTIQKTVNCWLESYDIDRLKREAKIIDEINGWMFRDVLRMVKPIPKNKKLSSIYKEACSYVKA